MGKSEQRGKKQIIRDLKTQLTYIGMMMRSIAGAAKKKMNEGNMKAEVMTGITIEMALKGDQKAENIEIPGEAQEAVVMIMMRGTVEGGPRVMGGMSKITRDCPRAMQRMIEIIIGEDQRLIDIEGRTTTKGRVETITTTMVTGKESIEMSIVGRE